MRSFIGSILVVALIALSPSPASARSFIIDSGRLWATSPVSRLTVLHNVKSLTTPSTLRGGYPEIAFDPWVNEISMRWIFPTLSKKLSFDCRVANIKMFAIHYYDQTSNSDTDVPYTVTEETDGRHVKFDTAKPTKNRSRVEVSIGPADPNANWTFYSCKVKY